MFFTWIDYTPSKYADYHYPAWADGLGWLISMTSVMAIPTVMVYQVCTTEHQGSVWEVRPTHKHSYKYTMDY